MGNLSRLDELEKYRNECAAELKRAQTRLFAANQSLRLAEVRVDDAQRDVNKWQMELDDTENDIRREMENLRNERPGA